MPSTDKISVTKSAPRKEKKKQPQRDEILVGHTGAGPVPRWTQNRPRTVEDPSLIELSRPLLLLWCYCSPLTTAATHPLTIALLAHNTNPSGHHMRPTVAQELLARLTRPFECEILEREILLRLDPTHRLLKPRPKPQRHKPSKTFPAHSCHAICRPESPGDEWPFVGFSMSNKQHTHS